MQAEDVSSVVGSLPRLGKILYSIPSPVKLKQFYINNN